MGSFTLYNDIVDRLKEGGWEPLDRGGRHPVWKHPNGAQQVVPMTVVDTRTRRANYMSTIRRKELNPNLKEALVPTVCLSAVPSPKLSIKPIQIPVHKFNGMPTIEPNTVWYTWMREMREYTRATRQTIAEELGGQWSTSLVKKMERGEHLPTPYDLKVWAGIMNVEVSMLEGFVPTRKNPAHVPEPAPPKAMDTPVTGPTEVSWGRYMSEVRCGANISTRSLAEMMQIGKTKLARLEHEVTLPTEQDLVEWKRALKLTKTPMVIPTRVEVIGRIRPVAKPVAQVKSVTPKPSFGDRKDDITKAIALLSSTRITDAEAQELANQLTEAFVRLVTEGTGI